MSTDEEVTKSERIKMELIVIMVVIIISLSIIILLERIIKRIFLERIIKKSLNYNFFYFNFLIMLLLSNSSHEIIIDHQNRWAYYSLPNNLIMLSNNEVLPSYWK